MIFHQFENELKPLIDAQTPLIMVHSIDRHEVQLFLNAFADNGYYPSQVFSNTYIPRPTIGAKSLQYDLWFAPKPPVEGA